MKKYISISKYNPKFRNSKGHYQKDEWTSIFDVGKVFNGEELEKVDYLEIEELYVKSVLEIVRHFNSESYRITCISKGCNPSFQNDITPEMINFYNRIDNGRYSLSNDELAWLTIFTLREFISPEIEFSDSTKIEFGYDYYMYLYTDSDVKELLIRIKDIGLFVI